mmetsp:Transcript_12343/g.30980  ORF Transcript_12343/g.30980 Transcript_12343/m.30980 type:complete len:219 (+) Transcript_12343:406-1062(+)
MLTVSGVTTPSKSIGPWMGTCCPEGSHTCRSKTCLPWGLFWCPGTWMAFRQLITCRTILLHVPSSLHPAICSRPVLNTLTEMFGLHGRHRRSWTWCANWRLASLTLPLEICTVAPVSSLYWYERPTMPSWPSSAVGSKSSERRRRSMLPSCGEKMSTTNAIMDTTGSLQVGCSPPSLVFRGNKAKWRAAAVLSCSSADASLEVLSSSCSKCWKRRSIS